MTQTATPHVTGWYAFRAYNSETLYGWAERDGLVALACDWLNKGREINLYSAEYLGDSDAETGHADGTGVRLMARTDLILTADSTADDSTTEPSVMAPLPQPHPTRHR